MVIDVTHFIPFQKIGEFCDNYSYRPIQPEEQYVDIYEKGKNLLNEIYRWHDYSGKEKATFHLVDTLGMNIRRYPNVGDFIKIKLPGIPNFQGKGFDWVKIIEIEENISSNTYIYWITVQPSDKCQSANDVTAHFLTEEASNTFIIACNPEFIQISVHGRNEVVNVKDEVDLFHKIRNHLTASGGFMGFNSIQWQSLIEGILRLA